MALPSFLFANNYTIQLTDICYQIYKNEKEKINITFPDCINFINVNGLYKYLLKILIWNLSIIQ